MQQGISMVVITIVALRDIRTGEAMIIDITLTDRTWVGFIITKVNIMNGTGIIISMADVAGNKAKPFAMKRFSDAERTRSSSDIHRSIPSAEGLFFTYTPGFLTYFARSAPLHTANQ